jgi:hypothetical protein
MSAQRSGRPEDFLRRWSRVKTEARDAPPAPAPDAKETLADTPAPELPRVEDLSIDSDFSGFFHPKVDENVRRTALRKLFSDPHFNVMDGLDTYIDDYSKSEPIPAAMLATMQQAKRIIDWAAETEEEAELRRATPPALPVEPEAQLGPPTEAAIEDGVQTASAQPVAVTGGGDEIALPAAQHTSTRAEDA